MSSVASRRLPADKLAALRPLEKELIIAARTGAVERAIELATQIQGLFVDDRRHHRLLRAKLWAFEACLDSNRLQYAQSGFLGVRKLAGPSTRLYLEASSLLAICYLRNKEVNEAKEVVREVVKRINNIKSDRTRRQFQKRLIERIEEECIFTDLMNTQGGSLDPKEIEEKAILLVQHNSDNEILKLIGNSVPSSGIALLRDVRAYSIEQIPPSDRKLLPPSEKAEEPRKIGKTAFAVLRRATWKTLCSEDSSVYKLWSRRVPKVFNQGYFSAAIVAALGDYRIGIPMIASGIVALAMKYSAEEFCEISKPKGIMISRKEDDD